MQLEYMGAYRIERLLGEGAFGVVYQAYQSFLDRYVAIKTLHADLTSDPQTEQQFMHEARTIARLRHPNIVSIYEFATLQAQPRPITYMVMEYLDGKTLDERMKEGQLEVAEVISIVERVARALDYAHSQNIIHRDLKPSNILFTSSGEPVIVDFGLSKLIGIAGQAKSAHETGMSGTPAYMSPEQANGDPTSPATDQYALATIAYQMLSGRLPFVLNEISEWFTIRLKQPPTPVRQYAPHLSPQVEVVLQRGLAINPADRYDNAGEFARELGDALLPDRRRAQLTVVSDPVQATQLRAARQALGGFLWGLGAVTGIIILFCISLFLRGYASGSPSFFVWNGVISSADRLNNGNRIVTGILPGSVAEQAGYQLGDELKTDLLFDYAMKEGDYTVNGVDRGALTVDWTPQLNDEIEQTVIRNGTPVKLRYRLERSVFPMLLLLGVLLPSLTAFGAALWLLRRWGAEPGLQAIFLLLTSTSLAILSAVVDYIVSGAGILGICLFLPTLLHIILTFPEPIRYFERHPRRIWWIYLPGVIGLIEFLLGHGIPRDSGWDIAYVAFTFYAVAITGAIFFKWIRRDVKRYPALWGQIAGYALAIPLSIVPIVILTLGYDSVRTIFGSAVNQYAIAYGIVSIGSVISILIGSSGFHRVQKQIGPSLIMQESRSHQQNTEIALDRA